MSTCLRVHVIWSHNCRFRCPCTNEEVEEQDGVKEEGMGMFLKAADVASVAGIHVNDIFLGRTANDVCPYTYTQCSLHN